MLTCEIAWRDTGDPAFVIDATILVDHYRQPMPPWLVTAIIKLLNAMRTEGHVYFATSQAIHYARWMAVNDAHFGKSLSWPKAHDDAADALEGTEAAGEPRTMRASYDKVRRDIKAGRSGAYLSPPLMPIEPSSDR